MMIPRPVYELWVICLSRQILDSAAPVYQSAVRMPARIDPLRSLGVLLLLGAGTFVAIWLAGLGRAPRRPSELRGSPFDGPHEFALRGMLFMTSLGFLSGLVGGLLEGAPDQSGLVAVLHAVFGVCWAPAAAMQRLEQALLAHDLTSRFVGELLSLSGLALIPVVWFVVGLGLVHVFGRFRQRSAGRAGRVRRP